MTPTGKSGAQGRKASGTRFTRRSVLGMAAATAFARPSIAQNTRAKTLRFVPSANLTFLDPNTTAGVTATHARAVFDTLYGLDNELRPRPQMVEGHEVSGNGLIWTFKLREGLKFHDGEPVRGKDCTASIARWGKRDSFGIALMGVTDHMEAPDDRTFKIHLKHPMASMLDALGHSCVIPLAIMPERLAQTDPFKQMPEIIGSGPYRFLANEYVSGSKAAYARFEGYVPRNEPPEWTAGGKIANFDRIEWLVIPDAATASAAVKSGEVDWLEVVQPDLAPSLAKDPNLVVDSTNQFGLATLLAFNFQNPPFDNVKLRRAVRDAINQIQVDFVQAIVGDDPSIYRLCQSMFGGGLPGVIDKASPKLSLEASKKAVAESGYKGEKVVVLDSTDYSFLSSGARIGADLMTRLGMNVDVQSMDFGTILQRRNNMEPVEKGGWSVFCTGADVLSLANPGLNYYVRGWVGGYKNETVNNLIDQWLGANDPKQLQQLFEQIQNVSFDDVPMIPLGQFKLRQARRKDLQGVLRSSSATFWNVKRV